MKKFGILFAVMIALAITVTGCNSNNPTKDFKNPKEIKVKTSKGMTVITYDDDKSYEEDSYGNEKILKNSDDNFRLSFKYSSDTLKQVQDRETNFKKDNNWDVISDVDFNGYKGFALVNKEYGTTEVYLTLDEKKEVVLVAKVSPMKTLETTEELKKAKNPADVLFKKDKVQQILKTISYKK